ncbi:hypothetical protein D9M71_625200 [compost metagenome]
MDAALLDTRACRHTLGLRLAQQHLLQEGLRVTPPNIRVHARQQDIVATAHQREVMPPLVLGHQLHHVPGNTRT